MNHLIIGVGSEAQEMKHCVFLTTDNLDGFVTDDDLLVEPLAGLSWKVHYIPWRRRDVDWNSFEAVVIRTPWDYQKDPESFLTVLEQIETSSAHLENSLDLVRWNIHKTYLRDLESRGIEIVPTLFTRGFNHERFIELCKEIDSREIIVKPVVSASADGTFRISQNADEPALMKVEAELHDRHVMVQPFMSGIVEEGEFSLFYFGGRYSHAILKTPKENDFRVQEEHGGIITSVIPEAELLSSADRVQSAISPVPLYTRIDFVRTDRNTFAVMEVELIEPALYFRMDPESPWRFAKAFDERMKG